jgi:hypothetical protein
MKPPIVKAFQLCAGSSIGEQGRTSDFVPPATFPVATIIKRFGRSEAGAGLIISPGIEPAAA